MLAANYKMLYLDGERGTNKRICVMHRQRETNIYLESHTSLYENTSFTLYEHSYTTLVGKY